MRFALTAALLMATTAAPVAAQDAIAPRVDKLERQMKAVQRKVFPGGSQQYFEPEITPQAPAATPGGVPAGNPLSDLNARVTSLEQELARLTGLIEQHGFQVRQLEEQLNRFKGDAEFRLNALEGNPTAPPGKPAPPGAAAATPAPTPAPEAAAPAGPAPAKRPPSGDAGEDAYLAAYDFWAVKQYPQAEKGLRDFITKYPNHKRQTFARNLLGRTLLDSGQPAKAAQVLLDNYKTLPRGERAPDSLYYLGQSLMALKPAKAEQACEVYRELEDVYGTTIAGPLKERVAKAKTAAKCKA
jgi:TolA-binding protein